MPLHIDDYALIGDCETGALVGRDGSLDWLCLPRFDSEACFAALLGTPENGRWLIAPEGGGLAARRSYRGDTLVLDQEFDTPDGAVRLTDFMTVRAAAPELVRRVEGLRGRVRMRMELVIRFDYGSIVPWVQCIDGGISAVAGPDRLLVFAPVPMRGEDLTTVAEFTVGEGQVLPFILSWHPSHQPRPGAVDPEAALRQTEAWWRGWSSRCTFQGDHRAAVLRSLITLKALTHTPTGGIVAAPTTSLPEQPGGVRNWDYRYCWLRDATFTLFSLLNAGYIVEATAWQEWLLRAVAGSPERTQIMYGVAGERRLTECELGWLLGYQGARPVRVGNAAHEQFQLDVYGEVLDAMYQARKAGLKEAGDGWRLEVALLEHVAKVWDQPDEGIWEVRGPRQHFVHSKVMAWVAVDRAVKSVEQLGLEGPVDRWRALRDAIHAQVCAQGFSAKRNAFVQSYGGDTLDASVLMMPLVGFLPAADPRMKGTVAAIEKYLMPDGFVARYDARATEDGLPPGEGAFLPCTFWLADNLVLQHRRDEARELFERLLGLCNDVGLIAEEYDTKARRLLGNFPQAFTHVGLVNTATNLAHEVCPVMQRPDG
jgi:GH15 family glucan-1,4-alpha-glucosidase